VEFCENEEDAMRVAEKLCLQDIDTVIVYDKVHHRLWVKNMLKSSLPLTNRNRMSFFANRDLDEEFYHNYHNDVDRAEMEPCCNVCALS